MTPKTRAPSVFLSYAREEDGAFALELAGKLETEGIDLWVDQRDIPAGVPWDREVEAALGRARIVLVILSPDSVGSENVLDEIALALDQGKAVVPVIGRACKVPMRLRRLQHLDLSGPDRDIDRLVRRLKQIEATPAATPSAAAEPGGSSTSEARLSGGHARARGAAEPDLDAILRRLYRALGGENALRAISSVRSVATSASSLGELSISITITRHPPRVRVEQRLGDLRGIEAFDGQTAWTWPLGGDEPARAPIWRGANLIAMTEIDTPLADYRRKGHRVELLDQDTEDDRPVHTLRVELRHGGEQLWFLDRETYLPYKVRGQVLSADGEVPGEAVYSDYREVEGVQVHHKLSLRPVGGSPVELVYSSIDFNVDSDPESFRMPERDEPGWP